MGFTCVYPNGVRRDFFASRVRVKGHSPPSKIMTFTTLSHCHGGTGTLKVRRRYLGPPQRRKVSYWWEQDRGATLLSPVSKHPFFAQRRERINSHKGKLRSGEEEVDVVGRLHSSTSGTSVFHREERQFFYS